MFGLDVRVPDLVYARVARPASFGGKISGFDAAAADPLASMQVSTEGFAAMAGRLREVAWRDWRAEVSLAERVEFDVAGTVGVVGLGGCPMAGPARAAGFAIEQTVIEAEGLCPSCQPEVRP